ncbi:DUF4240 domain-containing protein [Planococcus ruber]|uniref:DUF4240 domain-containing protein n=1 Tax=Planococcus ruber TaxID=2027871 RepID=UPI001FEFC274|nr:DUF4240 domain-containing protein [Planococcus ruber]MCJ1907484.1 DUF4240 domain-containing protein [Planococcus ruber]
MERSLVCITAFSNKFWKIKVQGNMFIVSYGRIGTQGSINTKEFSSEEHCLREANKLIQSKLKKGYRDQEEESGQAMQMTEAEFWRLIDAARQRGDYMEEQLEWLTAYLSRKSIHEIVHFDIQFNRVYQKSYTSDLWAAAYIIMGGCSDDSFDYFRAWLVFLGKDSYEKALADPESIMPYLGKEEDVPEFEDLLTCATIAFEEKTGLEQEDYLEIYYSLADEKPDPEIDFDWDEDDEETLSRKFPKLWAKYGEYPLG